MAREVSCHFCGAVLPDNRAGVITRVYVKDEGTSHSSGWERSVCTACLNSRRWLKGRVIRRVRLEP